MFEKQKTKNNFKKLIASGAIFLAFFVVFTSVGATGVDEAMGGLNESAERMHGTDPESSGEVITDIPEAIGKVVGAILAFVGTLFMILMIYSGLTWMLARGNEQEVQKAKDTIEASLIGLIIVLAAYAITAYIGGQL